ncbi:CrpP-related protein [Azohydromonas lata]|uniref:CrpP-related protein n=1 Tax=Azohydromonas lata TaxID=45677 RepID=A0ABU5IE45_9BURK|nr:CrpP-related protein [Azohydromonas lata]MDZ5456816.1 CrpP-related protein [Azohydromonas lata]
MDSFSELRLERDGARTAAQGGNWRTNPLLQAQNMPQATGESLGTWSSRHDAWQRGFEGYFELTPDLRQRSRGKTGNEAFSTLIEGRAQWLSTMRAYMIRHPKLMRRLPSTARHAHARDSRPRDLTITAFGTASSRPSGTQLFAIVDRGHGPQDVLASDDMEQGGVDDSALQELRLRADLGIRCLGWRYEYRGFRYDRLADAVAYAKLDRARQPPGNFGEAALADEAPCLPAGEERQTMTQWAIAFDAGSYRFQNFRYERLSDALAYAQLVKRRQAADEPRLQASKEQSL